MALVSSLFTAISGMRNQQTLLDVISNNVANVNTVGFKAGRVQFRDLLSQTIQGASGNNSTTNQGGINPIQSGAGVSVAAIDTLQTQGTFQATGNSTDMAINGDGFFVTQTGNSQTYTRAGSFRFDSNGMLVDPSGGLIQGWSAAVPTTNPLGKLTVDSSNPAAIGNIQIKPGETISASQTSNVALVGNLDAGATAANLVNSAGVANTTQITSYDYTPGNPPIETPHTYTVGQFKIPFTVYDSLGNAHTLTGTLTNLSNTQIPEAAAVNPVTGAPNVYDNNTWAWTVDTDASDTTVHLALDNSTYTDPVSGQLVRASSSGLIHFNNNGSLDWVTYGDRNAEHFGTHFDQLSANDPNIPGGNALPALPLPNPLTEPNAGAGTWADIANEDIHNSTAIGFEGATVPAADFLGASDQSVSPFNVPAGTNQPFDNPGVLQFNLGGAAPAPVQDAFSLMKLPIVLCYQNVPAGTPLPPANTTVGQLVNMDVGGMNEASTSAAGGPGGGGFPAAQQQWYVQKFDINWGTTSVITQADFDRNADIINNAGANPNGAGALNTVNETPGSPTPATDSTGDGQMDGAHTDLSSFGAFGPSGNVTGGTGASIGDRIDTLEMPWDPRVVRSSLGKRDGLTQDTTGSFLAGVYTPNFTARLLSQDGYSQGILQSVSVDSTGMITGVFNTKQGTSVNQDLARVAIATFTNPSGLAKVGDTHFAVTANSGSPVISTALSGDAGSVVSGVVEQSNVDLSVELTNMIVAQRGFEANARLITTSDSILNTLVQLGR